MNSKFTEDRGFVIHNILFTIKSINTATGLNLTGSSSGPQRYV